MIELLTLIPVILRAGVDWYIIEKEHDGINYLINNFFTFMVMTAVVIVISSTRDISYLISYFLVFGVYIALFDYTLNWFRCKNILQYYGSPKDIPNQSFLEKYILQKWNWKSILISKILLLIAAVTIYLMSL